MPTLNDFTINGAAINGGDALSLPASTQEICIPCDASWETQIPYHFPTAWELQFADITAAWSLQIQAAIEDC